jgi:sorbose reductase
VGVAVGKAAVDMTKEDYDSQMNPNVWGCFTVAQAAVK